MSSSPEIELLDNVVTKETTGSKDRYNESSYIDGFTRETALVNACKSGDLSMMKNLLNQGISINCLDVNSHTPLIGATIRRQVPAVRFLLANKANPDQAERYSGGTALHKAAAYGASDVLQLLIAAGADVGVRERPPSRATPLHAAVRATSLPCCEVLLAAGADPRAEDDSGVSPMVLAQDLGFTAAADLFARAPIPAAAEDDDEGATARRDGGLFNCCD